jgi:outer membrane protein assembly factor BamB/ABC-type phosphate/phosphonate transport system substrate-binding protein
MPCFPVYLPRRSVAGATALALLLIIGCAPPPPSGPKPRAARLLVVDPTDSGQPLPGEALARPRYDLLGAFFEQRLGRPVQLTVSRTLPEGLKTTGSRPELVIGPGSVVDQLPSQAGTGGRIVAALTDAGGGTTRHAAFAVRSDDPAKDLDGLKDRHVCFAVGEMVELRAAAEAALRQRGLSYNKSTPPASGASAALGVLLDKKADAVVVPGRAVPLLQNGKLARTDAVRVIGHSAAVPGVHVFIADGPDAGRIEAALWDAAKDAKLLAGLTSRVGFVPLLVEQRISRNNDVPDRLPSRPSVLWKRGMNAPCSGGVAVGRGVVIVADRHNTGSRDVWRCLDAESGSERWTFACSAIGNLPGGNAPRAQALIGPAHAWLLGAFGDLTCVNLQTGDLVWQKRLEADLGGRRPEPGYCATPLLVGGILATAPGSAGVSLAGLHWRTGDVLWRSPGRPTIGAPFLAATLGGRRQIVGCDTGSIGGWNPETGERLWDLALDPADKGHLPRPVRLGDRLLIINTRSGSHLHDFDTGGRILPQPAASAPALDAVTGVPVRFDDLLFACNNGVLHCLDAATLRVLWTSNGDAFQGHASLIAGNGRVLVLGGRGVLTLIRVRRDRCERIGRLDLVPGGTEVRSRPALQGRRLYVRAGDGLYCIDLTTGTALAGHVPGL